MDQRPLTPAQQQTAREFPWYGEWLIATCEHPAIQDLGDGRARCVRCPWEKQA